MICSKCQIQKNEEDFSFKNKAKGNRNTVCKACHKIYVSNHYKENAQLYKDRSRKNTPRYIKQAKDFVNNYLETHPCVDCGESRLPCLDFDHVSDRGVKSENISNMVFDARSIEAIKLEIAKCEVRCANCHRIRHYNENRDMVELEYTLASKASASA